jgi:peptidoglycan/LPS O-acetylase OafA/YrhL
MTTVSHENVCLALAETFDALFLSWLLVASLGGIKSRYAQFLGWSPLIYLGRISYGVYVYHVFIIILVSPFLIANGLGVLDRTLILLAVTFAVSSLSWHFLEQPVIAWKNNMTQAPRRAVLPKREAAPAPAFAPTGFSPAA